jgi:chorismate mutase
MSNTKHRKGHAEKVAKFKLELKQKKYRDQKRMREMFNNLYMENIKKEQESNGEQ